MENEYHGLERRKLPRVKEDTLMSYSLDRNPNTKFRAIVCDISTGGLRFATERNIVPQTKLTLEVFQACCDKNTIFCMSVKAETIWIRKTIKEQSCCDGGNIYEIGVKVMEIGEEDREELHSILKTLRRNKT